MALSATAPEASRPKWSPASVLDHTEPEASTEREDQRRRRIARDAAKVAGTGDRRQRPGSALVRRAKKDPAVSSGASPAGA
jgi:hypothetical protein